MEAQRSNSTATRPRTNALHHLRSTNSFRSSPPSSVVSRSAAGAPARADSAVSGASSTRAPDDEHDDVANMADLDDEGFKFQTGSGRRARTNSKPPGLGGRGETEGDYDEGWVGDLRSEEEDSESQGLLGGARRVPAKVAALPTKKSADGGARTISFGGSTGGRRFPPNTVRNQKYNVVTFFPLVLYEQFKFFFNLYFLLVALSQFVPALRIGFLATYIVPLAFVLAVTIGKEAFDDYKRYLRDKAANSTRYLVLDRSSAGAHPHSHHASSASHAASAHGDAPLRAVPSSRLKVGDIVFLEKNARVPADMVLMRTSDPSGTCFVRTDQLDGETDWKLRVAVERIQQLPSDSVLLDVDAEVYADPPTKDIHTFVGTLTIKSLPSADDVDTPVSAQPDTSWPVEPLTAENMLWANTVLAAGSALGFVVYTGTETRAVMNTSQPGTKVGLLDLEINRLAKVSRVRSP